MLFPSTLLAITSLNESLATFAFSKPEGFTFKPGQFLIISLTPGFEDSHPFSISSTPEDANLEISVRKLGFFTQRLHSSKPGTAVWIKGPYGLFTLPDPSRDVVLVAGGVGITPFLSMIRHEASQGMKRKLTLLYAVRNMRDVLQKEALDRIAGQNPGSFRLEYSPADPEPGWTGHVGVIDAGLLMVTTPTFNNVDVFLCGPPPMVQSLKQLLLSLGLPQESLHIDSWDYVKRIASLKE